MVRMNWKYRYRRLLAGFLIAMAGGVCHAEFAAPAEGPVAFRRDRVPLDADTLTALSRHLTTLARTQPMATPAERRTLAQLLALAQALDPGNAACRGLTTACRNGSHTPLEDPAGRSRSQAKIRQLADWLKLPQAGGGGQELAACLQDVATATDPGQPTVALTEAGAWTGWVPEIAAYEPRPKVTDEQPASSTPPTVEPASPTVMLPHAAVGTLAWKKSGERGTAEWLQVPTSLSMDTSAAEDPSSRLSIRIGPRDTPLEETARMIDTLLRKYHGDLPRGLRIRINCDELSNSPAASSPLLSSAAAAMLASAAITGREPDAFVLGKVDESGALTLPRTFWEQLLALGPGNGKRLVLPASAAGLLPSLLAIGNPGIFMDYEVLLARDFRHLLDLTAKEPPAAVAAASAKFRVIRDRMGNEDVRAYVANSFVRQRFAELAQEASYHASAAMLLIQGSGQRPTLVSRAVLTAELIRASNALSWILKTQDRDFEAWEQDQLEKTQDAYRKRLDELAALAAKTDQDLLESARALQQPLRDIERAQRGRGEYYLKMEAMWRARAVFSRQFTTLEKSLADEARKLAK
jgi:hypothetical protein